MSLRGPRGPKEQRTCFLLGQLEEPGGLALPRRRWDMIHLEVAGSVRVSFGHDKASLDLLLTVY